ncbi:hypothetical protein OC844_003329 [Tilletia horrida]|nr:hypothetical protein OC844_003329 [Tilletia horrida]
MTSRAPDDDAPAAPEAPTPTLTASPDPITASQQKSSKDSKDSKADSAATPKAGSPGSSHAAGDDIAPTPHAPSSHVGLQTPPLADGSAAPHPLEPVATTDGSAETGSVTAVATYPSPSGGLVPPPADEEAPSAASWQLRMPPASTSRVSKASTEEESGGGGGGSSSGGGSSAPTLKNLHRISTASSVAGGGGIAPARPSPIPASMETAERIASAASSRRGSAVVLTGPGAGAGAEPDLAGASPGMRPLSASRRSSSARGSKRISNFSLSSRGAENDEVVNEGSAGGAGVGAGTQQAQSNRLSVGNFSQAGGSSSRRASRSPAGGFSGTGISSGSGGTGTGTGSSVQSKHLSTASSRSGGSPLSPTFEHPISAPDSKRASAASGSGSGAGASGNSTPGVHAAAGGSGQQQAATAQQVQQQQASSRRRVQRGTSYLSTATSARTSMLLGPEARQIKVRDFGFVREDPRHFGVGDEEDEDEEEVDEAEEELDDGRWQGAGAGAGEEPATVASPEEHDYNEGWQQQQQGADYLPEEEEGGEQGEAGGGGLPHGWYAAMYAFDAESAHELTVVPGERLLVVGALPGGWAIVERDVGQDAEVEGAGAGAGAGGEEEPKAERGLVPEGYLSWLGEP